MSLLRKLIQRLLPLKGLMWAHLLHNGGTWSARLEAAKTKRQQLDLKKIGLIKQGYDGNHVIERSNIAGVVPYNVLKQEYADKRSVGLRFHKVQCMKRTEKISKMPRLQLNLMTSDAMKVACGKSK